RLRTELSQARGTWTAPAEVADETTPDRPDEMPADSSAARAASAELVQAMVTAPNGTSLKPFRAIVLQLGNVSWLHQARHRLRPTFQRPRLPPSGAVADAVVCDRLQHRIDQ